MSCTSNIVLAALCPICYVGLVLTFDYKGRDRNVTSSVQKRLLAALITSGISISLTYHQLDGDLKAMGFRLSGIVSATVYPAIITLTLYSGQILLLYFDGQLRHYLNPKLWSQSFMNICWIRDILVAPITEEIVYRACSASLVASYFSKWETVFFSPILFGISHLHHVLNDVRNGYYLKQALLRRGFQFVYTYIFGAYATYLLLSTKHIVSPIVTHCICNSLGLPLFDEIENFPSKWTRRAIWSTFFLGIAGFVVLVKPLTDSKLYI